jgi:uncharacterized protein (DUF983 family)
MAKVMVETPILMIMAVKGMVVMAKVMVMQPILMIVHSEVMVEKPILMIVSLMVMKPILMVGGNYVDDCSDSMKAVFMLVPVNVNLMA